MLFRESIATDVRGSLADYTRPALMVQQAGDAQRDPSDDSPGPDTGDTALLPLAEGPCPSCTALLDQLDGAAGTRGISPISHPKGDLTGMSS